MDVSADLVELGRTPVAVVCAGAKSILDIGRTLEVLVSSTMRSHDMMGGSHDGTYTIRTLPLCVMK